MRILIKGGVWKNTEDEILKAAVMKYGKNQWARISSLLTRKTPKQCKARWFDWLDPSIKKTEWSKEEDEKLLHLAKLMPTQWRTIAPIVGRTPAQCLERYHKLLDEAEAGDEEGGPNSDDVRKLRPGEIDPEPETKPARPDPVDMDEDEKEMLSEARARLANTQGKKAKRKAREKQLEEARRLTALQKRRELKAAGIETKVFKKLNGMNYNADIPFYKPQPAGFWDINDEIAREKVEKTNLTNELLSKLEGKRRMEIEEVERKKDFKRQKTKKEQGEYVPPQALRALKALEMTPRGKLFLPAPQVSEIELEEIVKMGVAGENVRAIVQSGEDGSSSLLSDYSTFRAPTPLRTPRAAAGSQDSLMLQARNLRAMTESQTPLLGGTVDLEGNVDFSGATPKRSILATPNPLAANLTPRHNQEGGAAGQSDAYSVGGTPRSNATVGGLFGHTPLRDQMGINTPRSEFSGMGGGETPQAFRQQQEMLRKQLSEHFASLPKPKNDFEIVVSDSDSDDVDFNTADASGMDMEEDTEDVLNRAMEQRKQDADIKRQLRSMVVQRDLPRPVVSLRLLEQLYSENDGIVEPDSCDDLIRQEKALLLQRDITLYPSQNQPPLQKSGVLPKFEKISLDLLTKANKLVQEEIEMIRQSLESKHVSDSHPDTATGYPNPDEFAAIHDSLSSLSVYDPSKSTYVNSSSLSSSDHRTLLKAQLDAYRETMKQHAIKAQKLEKRLGVTLGGYMSRSKVLQKDLSNVFTSLESSLLSLQGFRAVQALEGQAFDARVYRSRKELEKLAMMEQDLQDAYRFKTQHRDELLSTMQSA
ncbi:hypothetical protein BATDEDRAFT_35936 [Batrachochytrium dendrobatidis JAM81]|uniref:Pre-mRNA-splicing factor CEF1 n=2 Tax=Batrachochytrium dendrobatidis TaxID=109871 RepID=F4PAV1_BATDJ|nr:uncharacterized protein BATDEDRAFT_35936 [Batrachochytrium dendrobatidis JAM81]EGF77607.1 hypothetical protein BATDEDRAFT_35936 [Batrachochytrium dendrobatidis JAM81]KAJ8323831.1 Pre-mRNA-splicing factor cef1 [Batrachochytrium dendrobatidis]OAJ43192.1 hypothetical protein BDEG_26569 [Batrachochytrium dendrobatidis JEL423]|eukprot:XP_006681722.1 hypothetical protein BATDEDRAFT_35936 [Batrachochytrium dendrobatidis JAM81]